MLTFNSQLPLASKISSCSFLFQVCVKKTPKILKMPYSAVPKRRFHYKYWTTFTHTSYSSNNTTAHSTYLKHNTKQWQKGSCFCILWSWYIFGELTLDASTFGALMSGVILAPKLEPISGVGKHLFHDFSVVSRVILWCISWSFCLRSWKGPMGQSIKEVLSLWLWVWLVQFKYNSHKWLSK